MTGEQPVLQVVASKNCTRCFGAQFDIDAACMARDFKGAPLKSLECPVCTGTGKNPLPFTEVLL